ncbi:MAG: ATP-binding protein, partial [Ruminococcaceae bacterium]|nr:ATP-binding protein [Oscillospiraceae bacterium]
ARERQRERFRGTGITCNARATGPIMRETFRMTADAQTGMKLVYERLGLSGRTYDSLLKVARTIADVQGAPDIERQHIMEAVHYRSLEHKYWQRRG